VSGCTAVYGESPVIMIASIPPCLRESKTSNESLCKMQEYVGNKRIVNKKVHTTFMQHNKVENEF
jgi:hypothetical protein